MISTARTCPCCEHYRLLESLDQVPVINALCLLPLKEQVEEYNQSCLCELSQISMVYKFEAEYAILRQALEWSCTLPYWRPSYPRTTEIALICLVVQYYTWLCVHECSITQPSIKKIINMKYGFYSQNC